MAELGIVVEADLGVENQQHIVVGDGERVDLDLRGVGADEGIVQFGQHLRRLFGEVALEAERGGDGAAVVRHQPGRRIDGDGLDLLRRVVGDRLDIHAAFGRGDDGDAAGLAVDQQCEIEFLGDVDAVGDVEALDLLPCGPVWTVTRVLPSISSACGADLVDRCARRTPPLASGPSSLNLPLPRPPAWICDFTTQSGPGSFFAASTASSTLIAAWPAGTGTPNFASSSLA